MKNLPFNKWLAVVAICSLSVSCLDDDNTIPGPNADVYTSLSALVNDLKPEAQTFELDPTTGGTITGAHGTSIEILPDAFTDGDGNPITTPITIYLKEYLTLKQMFMGNIQTESNGQILVTGGNFDLTFKDENDNSVISNPWSITSRIPVATDITGYEDQMSYFVGEVTTNDGKETVNWTQGQAEFWMDEDGFFNTIGVQQGLSNCDVLYDMASQLPTQFEVTVTGVTDYSRATVWMFIEDFPSVIMISSLNGTSDALATYTSSIPVGLNATLIAMAVDENNYLKFGSLPITVEGDETFNIDVIFGTTNQLSALIDTIAN